MNYDLTEFDRLRSDLTEKFLMHAERVDAAKWQSTKAPAPMMELFDISFTVETLGCDNLDIYRDNIQPNLPWADRHFEEERVSGMPINPGETWKIWPYGHSAARHLREGENIAQYDHSYAERYWPKFAGSTPDGRFGQGSGAGPRASGIRFPIGDLNDLVRTLVKDPLTRQAYLPIFFPEDTAAASLSKRVPCTLGYHFIRRNDRLHVIYPMRSCDFIRHWADDVYLTMRLLLWVLDRCQQANPTEWNMVIPGRFTMHITSLHMFLLDYDKLAGEYGGA